MAERPDEIEHEQSLRDETFFALERTFGPRQWDATVAILAEGEAEGVDYTTPADGEPDGLTLQEIATELGLSRGRVWQIIMCAFRKLRTHPTIRELHGLSPILHPVDLDEAIARAAASTLSDEEDQFMNDGEYFVVREDVRRPPPGYCGWIVRHTHTLKEYGRFASYGEAQEEADKRNRPGDVVAR